MTAPITYGYVGDILKFDEDTGLYWAVATGSKEDLDRQTCDPEWLSQAMPKYMSLKGGGNLREMHSPFIRPAGKVVEALQKHDGDWATAVRIDTPEALKAVQDDRYTGVSIGVTNAVVKQVDGGPVNGVICGGDIIEISLVDRPAYQYSELKNDRAAVMKRAKDEGHAVDVELITFLPKSEVIEHALSLDPSEGTAVKYDQPWVSKPGVTTPEEALAMAGGIEKRADEPVDEAKAVEPDLVKADGEVDEIPGEPQHTSALGSCRQAIKDLITQELAEAEPERTCVRLLLSVWDCLEDWVSFEAAEHGDGVVIEYVPLDYYWTALADLAKTQGTKTASGWLPPLLTTGEVLMTQAKEKVAEQKAAQADLNKAAGPTSAALLALADTKGVPEDVATQLRAMASGSIPSFDRPGGTVEGSGVFRDGAPGEPLISPATLQLTSQEAGGGAAAGAMDNPAFDRKSVDADDIRKMVAEAVREALEPVVAEVAKVAGMKGAVVGTVDAVEASHDATLTKIASVRADLEKAVDEQVGELRKSVEQKLERITKLAQPSRALAAEDHGLRPAEKRFATNPDPAPQAAGPAETELATLIAKAAAGDLNAQQRVREAFMGQQLQPIAEQAYAATIEQR